MQKIYDASPKAMARVPGQSGDTRFEELKVGQCLIFVHGSIPIGSLRNKASRLGKKLGRKFTVVDHGPNEGYEVARVA